MKASFLKKMLSLGAAILLTAGASAQTLTVGEGEATNQYVPIYGYYYDTSGTISQVLYPASDLTDMVGKKISDVTFYANKNITFSGGTQKVSLKEVEETELTGLVADLTTVYEGTLVAEGSQITINFTEPYQYAGGNLVLSFEITYRGTCSGSGDIMFLGKETETNHGYCNKLYSAALQKFMPKTTFGYFTPADFAAKVNKESLEFGTFKLNELPQTLNVKLSNMGTNAFTPAITFSNEAFSTTYEASELAAAQNVEIPVVFAPTAIGDYEGTMTITAFEGENGTFTVALSGKAYGGAVAPEEVDFGATPINKLENLAPQIVKFTNYSGAAVTPTVTAAAPFGTTYEAAEVADGETVDIPVTFAPTAMGEYAGTLQINGGAAGAFEVALVGKVTDEVFDITVCDGQETSEYVPIQGYNFDGTTHATQMIYPAEMLTELKGNKITSLTFYPNTTITIGKGKATISLMETEETQFEKEEMFEGDMTAVGTWAPAGNDATIQIDFAEGFEYHGGNLLIQFNKTESATEYTSDRYQRGLKFYGQAQDVNAAYHYEGNGYSADNLLVQFLPKTTFGYVKMQVEPVEPVITLTPAPGTYTEDQVVIVAVENMPEGGKVQYMLGEATAWTDYTDNGITITATTDLTVAVLDAAGQIVARQMGTYTINKPIVITFTPDGGEYTEAVNVKINVENMPEGAVLKYSQVDAEDEFINMDVVYTEDGVDVTESGYILAVVYDANNTYLADAFSEDFVINIPVEYTITMTPAPGTYDGPQTVTVAVEPELPQGAKIVYTYVEAQPTQGAPRKAEGDVEENDYLDSGIEITTSGLLTIIVRDADGQELANTEGEYVINGTHVGIEALTAGKPVKGIRYYNAAGQQSTQLQQGVNIVVVTYDDGTRAVAKVVK